MFGYALRSSHLFRFGFASACLLGIASTSAQAQTDYAVTNFIKTSNVYTNLNQQYPHSGTGTPGSGVGTANQTFVFNPQTYKSPNAVPNSNKTTNGVAFTIASNADGHDFTEVNNLANGLLTIPVNIAGAQSVHLLINSYFNPTASFTFAATGGVAETFSNVQLHDFNGGGSYDQSFTLSGSATPNLLDQTTFQVNDVGAGGTGNSSNGDFNTYGLEEYSFLLFPSFTGQTLQSISIQANGSNPILLGATVRAATVTAVSTPEPGGLALLVGMGLSGAGLLARRRKNTGKAA